MLNHPFQTISTDTLLRAIPDPIIRVHRDGTYLEVVAPDTTQIMPPAEEFIGRNMADFVAKSDIASVRESLHLALTTKDVVQTEYRILFGTNCYYHEARILPADNDTVFLVLHDLTRQRKAEQNLHDLLANTPCLIWYGTITRIPGDVPEGEMEFDWDLQHSSEVNRRNFVPLDVPPGVPYSEVWRESVPAEDWDARHANSTTALKEGRPSYTSIFRSRDRYDAIHWIREEVHLERIDANTWRGVGLFTDITDHKKVEQRLQESERRLEERLAEQQVVEQQNQKQLQLLQEAHEQLQHQQQELAALNAKLEALATTDSLTGLKNRRVFEERLENEYQRTQRLGKPLSILLLDADRFKQYNDSFGHPAGDMVLRALAQMLIAETRPVDLVARYGGEEFGIIMPNVGPEGSVAVAERIRLAVSRTKWAGRPVTVSIGAATLTPDIADWPELVRTADQMLYRSKSLGRNRVTHAIF